MGIIKRPCRVKLVTGLLFNDPEKYNTAKKALARIFGRIDFESDSLDFVHTAYYNAEMAPGLKRRFLSFERLCALKNICAVKVKTNALEKRYAKDGRRQINIDPGYLDLAKLVLFSTKDYTHRIYVDKDIYAEVTLFYKDNSFNTWPWTYPDYKSTEYIHIFESMRQIYKEQITKKG